MMSESKQPNRICQTVPLWAHQHFSVTAIQLVRWEEWTLICIQHCMWCVFDGWSVYFNATCCEVSATVWSPASEASSPVWRAWCVGICLHFIGTHQSSVCYSCSLLWWSTKHFNSLFQWGQWLTREAGLDVKKEGLFISFKAYPLTLSLSLSL